jgi:dolichyl-phosphate beta-glucosyltransferase
MQKKLINNLSFIIPVYNEESRLDHLFKRIHFFSNKNKKIRVEYILVNDGSTDNSKKKIKNFISTFSVLKKYNVSLVDYSTNKGKGYAIKKGILKAKNDWLLTLDADLSVDFEQIIKWNNIFDLNTHSAYWGSRLLKSSKVNSKLIRKYIGIVLISILKIFFNFNIKDTQCGFKLYHKNYSKKLFKKLDIYDFSHDIKLLFLLKRMRIDVVELPLNWCHRAGSKVNLLVDSFIFLYRIISFKINKLHNL